MDEGLSQQALAERSNLTPELIGRLERAVVAPGLETILKISVGLGVHVTELLVPFTPEVVGKLALVARQPRPGPRSPRGRKVRA